MKKKSVILIFMLAILGMNLSAQNDKHYGIYFGGSINMMQLDEKFFYDDSELSTNMLINGADTTYTARYLPIKDPSLRHDFGFFIGGFFEYDIDEIFGMQLHLLVNQYNYWVNGLVYNTTLQYKGTMEMLNISAALFFKIHFWKKRMSIDLGVQPSYCVRMIKETEHGNKNLYRKRTIYNNEKDFKPINFCAAIGATYNFTKKTFLSARYNVGFVNILNVREPYVTEEKPYTVKYIYTNAKSTTNSLMISIGYRFN